MKDEFVLTLIEAFNKSGLGELDYSDGNCRLVLRKNVSGLSAVHGQSGHAGAVHAVSGHAASGHAASAHAGLPALPGEAQGPADNSGALSITSPIVGTFYPSAGPDAPSFVRPGSKVKAGDTLCILEAMKMMNHLEAEFDCEIIAVKAASGELVEFGQELFEVRRL